MVPYLIYGGYHLDLGWLILGACVFFGLFVLLLWVPGSERKSEHAIEMIRYGYQMIIAGVLGFLFSTWFLVICVIAMIAYIIYLVIKGLNILRNQ